MIEEILEFIRFDASVDKQSYSKDSAKKNMFDLQVEGVAEILSRFDEYNIALLSDEVGMGKTFQALAIIAYQFRKKPESKVLVITPRKEVLSQWKNEEYEEFYKNHIISENKYLPTMNSNEIGELYNFSAGLFQNDNNKIVFAKTTSFMSSENIDMPRRCKLETDIAEFDLIIVDEAHKFRNYNTKDEYKNHSNTIQTAMEIFKNIETKQTKVLLMTATPLHSRRGDVKRVVDLFYPGLGNDDKEIMGKIMTRRLRIMSNGKNKYSYRNEIENSISLSQENSGEYKNELFFAMLQKKYAQTLNTKDLSKSKYLLDYLEGTNFNENDDEDSLNDDIIGHVVHDFHNAYEGKYPTNNKYETLVNKIKDEKSLVFVRRKASAYEISRLYINEFDKKAWKLIDDVLDSDKRIMMPKTRDEFERILTKHNVDDLINTSYNMIDWNKFTEEVEKFRISEKNLPENVSYIKTKKAKMLILDLYFENYDSYDENEFKIFVEKLQYEDYSSDEDKYLVPKSIVLDFFKKKKAIKSTHASRFLQKFSSPHSPYEGFFGSEAFKKMLSHDNYDSSKIDLVKSAVLHSSIGLVELYCCDLKSNNYLDFIEVVKKNFDEFGFEFVNEVRDFLEYFDKFEKYLKFNINSIESENRENETSKKVEYNHEIFFNAQPAYPYVGGTKNTSVISRFNSPFFPKLLCGTSTLQEGVNLHLFCDRVFHFGAANTMGDDEQRVGRVDRLMGKVDRRLKNNENDVTLDIYYPYLKSTFDEDNLRRMLCRKRFTERLIDEGTHLIKDNEEIDCTKNIDELLLKPLFLKNNTLTQT